MIEVKKGASFRVALQFTDDEWESISDVDSATSELKQGNSYYTLETEIDSDTKRIFLRAETYNWKKGSAAFDVKLIKGGTVMVIPELTNVEVKIVEGVTR